MRVLGDMWYGNSDTVCGGEYTCNQLLYVCTYVLCFVS